MNLSNNYWFFKKALSDTVCDDIIKYGNQQQDESALVGNEDSLTEDLNIDGKIRKLSVTVSLSNSKDYEGGELEFDFRNKDPEKKRNIVTCEEIVERGSIVVFPSHLWHRVQPVTKGIRYSLVIWSLGQPFK